MAIPRLGRADETTTKEAPEKPPAAAPDLPIGMPDMPQPTPAQPVNASPADVELPEYIPEDPDEVPSLEAEPGLPGITVAPGGGELDLPPYQEPEPFDPGAETVPASDENLLSFQDMLGLDEVPWWKRQAPAPAAEPEQAPGPEMTPEAFGQLAELFGIDPNDISTADILERMQQLPPDHPVWAWIPLARNLSSSLSVPEQTSTDER